MEVAYGTMVAIFLLFLTLRHVLIYKQADATLASLSILKNGALKRVIRGSKNKSAWILFKSMSDRRPWLKNSKNVIIFQMRHMVLTLGVVKGQRLVFKLYRSQKIKLLQFSWKWWQMVKSQKQQKHCNYTRLPGLHPCKLKYYRPKNVGFPVYSSIWFCYFRCFDFWCIVYIERKLIFITWSRALCTVK